MKSITLSQLSIQALRYAQGRDNHLAPFGAISNIKECLLEMDDETKFYTIGKLIGEIDFDLKSYDREQKYEWNVFYAELGNMLIEERGNEND
jgi:hypothetical protein